MYRRQLISRRLPPFGHHDFDLISSTIQMKTDRPDKLFRTTDRLVNPAQKVACKFVICFSFQKNARSKNGHRPIDRFLDV